MLAYNFSLTVALASGGTQSGEQHFCLIVTYNRLSDGLNCCPMHICEKRTCDERKAETNN